MPCRHCGMPRNFTRVLAPDTVACISIFVADGSGRMHDLMLQRCPSSARCWRTWSSDCRTQFFDDSEFHGMLLGSHFWGKRHDWAGCTAAPCHNSGIFLFFAGGYACTLFHGCIRPHLWPAFCIRSTVRMGMAAHIRHPWENPLPNMTNLYQATARAVVSSSILPQNKNLCDAARAPN